MVLNEHGRESVELLKQDPIAALTAYNPPVAQWEMPLHKEVICRIERDFSKPSEAVSDQTFLKDIHTILKAWYGKRAWLVVDFHIFKSEIKLIESHLDKLSQFRIERFQDHCLQCRMGLPPLKISPQDLPTAHCIGCVTSLLWATIESLNLTTGNAKIVSGTKTLHHLLPNLLPPMDNRYTGEFFLGYGIGQGGEPVFRNLYSGFVDLARCLTQNEKFMSHVGQGFNTSLTKTLDNAIIGFVTREDMAMAHAIEEGMKTPVASKQELLDILQPKHVHRS